ncbi:uncharacterized protein LOC105829170 [Monomorium pharaonis]|uniref:uncharacterized protein LOC105829170 n=1 Tax=Monomorium pharaonis TaxID=307658 RepID=UPI001745D0CC|nr:uncharacterized protein LOC105829170 [Monomorium pharaonis]
MLIKICVTSIIIYFGNIFLVMSRPNSLNKHEELRKNINKVFYDKHSDEMFLQDDKYEYPRTNKILTHLYKQQWLNYYKCLEEVYADVNHERIIYPTALVALEETSVTLKCQICISPMEMHVTGLIEWYFNSSSSSNNNKHINSKSSLQNTNSNSQDNQYITINNVKLEQAGIYWCEVGDTIGSVYYLDIDSNSELVNVRDPNTPFYASQVTLVENMPEYNLKVYTAWTTWSLCSTCDAVGIKLQYGYCTVSLSEMFEHEYFIKESTTMNELRRVKPDKGKEQVRLIPIIKDKNTEIIQRYCKTKCQRNIIFEIRDKKGNILESANNSAGIFSMIQEMPQQLSSVARSVIYEKRDKKLKLICPGNLNPDIPIVWRINNKTIIPSHIKFQSKGRIHINPQMQIVFKSLKFEDTNIYSCWQNNEVAGIIKLNIIESIEFTINHHVILIGVIVIIGVILIMFWRAFKGQTRYTMH